MSPLTSKTLFWKFGVAAVLTAALFLSACKKSTRRKTGKGESTQKVERLNEGQIEQRLQISRVRILASKYDAAAEMLKTLEAQPSIKQPLANWITLHLGLTHLLAGNDADARAAFAKIAERDWQTTEPSDSKVADFFRRASAALKTDKPVPSDVAKQFDRTNFEAFALFLIGIKNWNLEAFDDATFFLRQFSASDITAPALWLGTYDEIEKFVAMASNIEEADREIRNALKTLDEAQTPEEKKAAIAEGKAARAKLKLSSKPARELEKKLTEMEPKVTAVIEETKRMTTEADDADAKALPAAKKKWKELLSQLRFEEARVAIAEPELKTDVAKEEQELLVKKAQWLANFKSNLIDDLTAKGSTKAVTRKDGTAIAGRVAKADEQFVHISGPPPTTVAWSDLSHESIIAMARGFIDPELAPFLAAFRKWNLGAFEVFAGKTDDARKLLTEAAEGNEAFKEELPILLEGKPFE